MLVSEMTAAQIRATPHPGARIALARSEGRRIAAGRDVPVAEAGSPECRGAFNKWGLACVLDSACGIFGTAPDGYYDHAGLLRLVRIPLEPTAGELADMVRLREGLITKAEAAGRQMPPSEERKP